MAEMFGFQGSRERNQGDFILRQRPLTFPQAEKIPLADFSTLRGKGEKKDKASNQAWRNQAP